MAGTEVNQGQGLGQADNVDMLDALSRWPAEKLDREELVQLVDAGEIEAVVVATPDIQGKLYGKTMPAGLFLAEETVEFASGPLTTDNDWQVRKGRFPDLGFANAFLKMDMHPDLRSLRRLANLEKTAIVIADGTWVDSGKPVEQLPRRILARQLEKAAEHGLAVVCAVETEFLIFAEDYSSAHKKHYVDLDRVSQSNAIHSILHTNLLDPLLSDLRQTCAASGIPIEAIMHEWGRVQLELTLTYSDAMEAADRISLFKLITKQVCLRHGVVATFMARYSNEEPGSSGHVHLSIWDLEGQRPLMADTADGADLGRVGRQWLGGQMNLCRELMPLFCPSVNSYKRLDAEALAPTTVAWGRSSPIVPYRICGKGPSLRIENRIPGADANFYLALAAMIASGLYGIDHDLAPVGEPVQGVAAPGDPLPNSLPAALARFRDSGAAREMFGDKVIDHLVATAEHELDVYDREVSDIDRRRAFELS